MKPAKAGFFFALRTDHQNIYRHFIAIAILANKKANSKVGLMC